MQSSSHNPTGPVEKLLEKQELLQKPLVRILLAAVAYSILRYFVMGLFSQQFHYHFTALLGRIFGGVFGDIGLGGIFVIFFGLLVFSLILNFLFALLVSIFLVSERRIKYFFVSFLIALVINIPLNFFGATSIATDLGRSIEQKGALEKISETYAKESDGLPHLRIRLKLSNKEKTVLSGRVSAASSYPHLSAFLCDEDPERITLGPGQNIQLDLDCYTRGSGNVENYMVVYSTLPKQLDFQVNIESGEGLPRVLLFKTDERNWTSF